MNRFRKMKKAKEVDDFEAIPLPSVAPSKTPKKNKMADLDMKPALDLSSALPSTDNFRTSLLMPNLSARFSMLREQDDPNTKLGKANDDSVLFPKRQSRLNLFGHNANPLSDIAEVASIDGRSSLALRRTNSYVSTDEATDDDMSINGSMMSRKRPGEGNNLFGGRQKVYKIPVSASGRNISNSEGAGMRGRAVYDDDVTLSAFQRLKLKEKEQSLASFDDLSDSLTPDFDDGSAAFSAKRTTSSSTTSGRSNRRTSTAATSIDEQPTSTGQQGSLLSSNTTPVSPVKPAWPPTSLERNVTKTRRLYGQGLAQTVQEQQSSALNRLEGLNRQRAGAGTPDLPRLNRTFSRSATNLNDRKQRLSPVQAASVYRGPSPPPLAESPQSQALDRPQQELAASTNSDPSTPSYGFVPPLSPPISEVEESVTLAAAVQPEDRGKATAMGLFNKPSGPYDEQQFMKLQLQMHEGRNTPPIARRSPSNSMSKPETVGRPRGLSTTSYASRAESASSCYSGEAHHTGPHSRGQSVKDSSPPRIANGTFMMNLSSDSESDAGDHPPPRKVTPARSQAFDGIHPAFRSRPPSRDSDVQSLSRDAQDLSELKYHDHHDLNPIQEHHVGEISSLPTVEEPSSEKAPDSPTLGPSGLGLSGLIRTHLRHDSNQSSTYPPPSPRMPNGQNQMTPDRLDDDISRESHPPASIHSNPWEYDDIMAKNTAASQMAPEAAVSSGFINMTMRAKQLRDQASALREQQTGSRPGSRAESLDQNTVPRQELKLSHKRNGSTETQKEREDFANELAERRRRVQENLNRIGDDSRSNSPAQGRQIPDVGQTVPGNAFAMLKNRSMKQSPSGKQDGGQPKASKIFGLMNASSPSLASSESWRDGDLSHGLGRHSNSSSPHITAGRSAPRPAAARSGINGSQDEGRESGSSRAPSPPSFTNRQRDRSTSASGRSKSRTRPRDDLEMVAEHSISRYEPEEPHVFRGPSASASARPSVDSGDRMSYERSTSSTSGRFRSNSRTTPLSHLELPPIQTTDISSIGTSPRPSPVTPYSANATPPLYEADGETPGASPVPSVLSFGAYNFPQRASGSHGLAKRSIDKSSISEPTFVSSTSHVPTVGLPVGASLSNGMETPPIPPMNPRRRRTTATQTIIGALKGEKPLVPPVRTGNEERSTFSDEDEKLPLSRARLRKTSSEGGSLNARARQQAMMAPSPAMSHLQNPTSVEGGMI